MIELYLVFGALSMLVTILLGVLMVLKRVEDDLHRIAYWIAEYCEDKMETE